MSTVKKSHASTAVACARRNSAQVGPARLGVGSTPCRRRIAHTPEVTQVLGGITLGMPDRLELLREAIKHPLPLAYHPLYRFYEGGALDQEVPGAARGRR